MVAGCDKASAAPGMGQIGLVASSKWRANSSIG